MTEEPIWLYAGERAFFGWLTRPDEQSVRGGVLLALPIGREVHAARRAFRSLATLLAAQGFAVLRFDYPGVGDSSGDLKDSNIESSWIESAAAAAQFLRACGVNTISAVGLRFGATIAGLAGSSAVKLSSLVLWDPCESGRSYLREQSALEALRRERFNWDSQGSVETSEMVFTSELADELRRLNLSNAPAGALADRVLALIREDRSVPAKLQERLSDEAITWETTYEQAAMFDTEPYNAVLAENTMARIVEWLCEPPVESRDHFTLAPTDDAALVTRAPGESTVHERFRRLGPRGLFAIESQGEGEQRGPWILLLNVSNEAHTGPARLWVELSRRWASAGLRCIRFDLSGLGDSPAAPGQSDRPFYDGVWINDVRDVAHSLSPEDPSQVVLVGLCSGAFLAAEAAYALRAQGVCLINPPVGTNMLHGVVALERSSSAKLRTLGASLKLFGSRHRWIAAGLWQVGRFVMPRPYSEDLLATIAIRGTTMLVLGSTQDLSPYPNVPILRSIDRRRVAAPRRYKACIVPDLDHSMLVSEGRERAVAMLDEHVLQVYAGVAPHEISE